MSLRNVHSSSWKSVILAVLGLAAMSTLLLAGAEPAWASRALVYNATGKDLRVVVNGRASLIPWTSPVHVFSGADQGNLHFEMANTDGELLKRDLEPDSTYVILYRVSHKAFALWRTEALESNLDKILAEHPATARAAVFNSTGRPMIFKYGPWKQGVSDELCVFTPNAKNPSNLKFKNNPPGPGLLRAPGPAFPPRGLIRGGQGIHFPVLQIMGGRPENKAQRFPAPGNALPGGRQERGRAARPCSRRT